MLIEAVASAVPCLATDLNGCRQKSARKNLLDTVLLAGLELFTNGQFANKEAVVCAP